LLFFCLKKAFLDHYIHRILLKDNKLKEEKGMNYKMFNNFNEEAQEILVKAKLEMLELHHPYVGTEHLVLAILHTKNELTEKLSEYNLTYNKFKKEIISIIGKGTKKSEFFLYTPLLKKVIETAIMTSTDNNNKEVTANHLFAALLEVGEGIAIRIFISMKLDLDHMYDIFTSKVYIKEKKSQKLLIESLGVNLNEKAKNNEIDPVIGRETEIEMIEEILCRRSKNNPLLIGEPGTGKTAIVEELAKRITEGNVSNKLKNKKIISLDMASTVAGTKYRGEFEERMKKIIDEIEHNDQIILFIDEIHTLIGAGGAEGAIDASNILKPALARGKIKCIGATTNEEYKKHFEKDKALERRFQLIHIKEPTIEETKNILLKLKPLYEQFHNVIVKDEIIDKIIELSEKYLYDRYRPDKQIDILDEVCSKVSITENKTNLHHKEIANIIEKKELYIKENNLKKAYEYKIKENNFIKNKNQSNPQNKVSIQDIANVIHNKTTIPIYEIMKDTKKVINNISESLKNNIIGQEKAINDLINITKRIKLGYHENKCISLLFTGPTGVGKTKLATLYGNLLTNNKIIKLDMSEYSDITSVNKFLGSSPGYIGYNENKHILSIIKDNPNSTIILDEIDKAHPKILNLLYQILDTGKIKDAKNNTINFNNNIIIMTTNKGTEEQPIGFTTQKDFYIEELKDSFNIALLNRIDNIISFNKLTRLDISKIINNQISKLQEKYHDINLQLEKEIINEITDLSCYQEYGARKISKIISNQLENIIIDNLLKDKKNIIIDSILSK